MFMHCVAVLCSFIECMHAHHIKHSPQSCTLPILLCSFTVFEVAVHSLFEGGRVYAKYLALYLALVQPQTLHDEAQKHSPCFCALLVSFGCVIVHAMSISTNAYLGLARTVYIHRI